MKWGQDESLLIWFCVSRFEAQLFNWTFQILRRSAIYSNEYTELQFKSYNNQSRRIQTLLDIPTLLILLSCSLASSYTAHQSHSISSCLPQTTFSDMGSDIELEIQRRLLSSPVLRPIKSETPVPPIELPLSTPLLESTNIEPSLSKKKQDSFLGDDSSIKSPGRQHEWLGNSESDIWEDLGLQDESENVEKPLRIQFSRCFNKKGGLCRFDVRKDSEGSEGPIWTYMRTSCVVEG